MSTVEERLQRLEDIEVARGIFHTYAETLDTPSHTTVAALFTEDAVLDTPAGHFEGRAAIADFYRSVFAADPSVKRHFIVNPRVVHHSVGRVVFESYFLYVGRGTTSLIGWGTYHDVVDVTSGSPVFVAKRIDMHARTDVETGWAKD